MTPTEKAKRSDALYYETVSVNRRVLCDMIANRESDLEELRKLARHMHTCIEHYEPDGSVGCEHCPLNNDTGNCDYERRMRELGIEVDA